MVDPISAQGPIVQPLLYVHDADAPAPADDGSVRADASRQSARETARQDDADHRGANGNKHGGPPGRLAKDLIDDRARGSLLGTLVSLIAQGQFEEAERLVAELTAQDGENTGDTTGETTSETLANSVNGTGSGSGSDGGSHGGSHGGLGSGSGDTAFFSTYLNGATDSGAVSDEPAPTTASSLSVVNLTSPNGTIEDNGDGTYTFTPNENFNGEAALNYSVSDGLAAVVATATVTIAALNEAPVVSGPIDLGHIGVEDEPFLITAASLLETATDLDGDTLSVENLASPNGTIEDNGDGTYTFTPNENFNGETVLNYSVSDGTASVEATATVTIHAVNDAPVISGPVDLGQLGVEGEPFIITAASLLATATDVDDVPVASRGAV